MTELTEFQKKLLNWCQSMLESLEWINGTMDRINGSGDCIESKLDKIVS